MQIDEQSINIAVTGDDSLARKAVTNVIAEALEDAGFNDVSLINSVGEPLDKEEPTSILDLIQRDRPELFAIPVAITSRSHSGLDDDEMGGSDDESLVDNPGVLNNFDPSVNDAIEPTEGQGD